MDLKALYNISYGLYVVASKKDGKLNGQISNTVMQVTSEPAQVAVCINKENLTHEYIESSKVFAVSVLQQETPMKFIGTFGFKSGRDIDKFEDIDYETGTTGSPLVLPYTLSCFECEVKGRMEAGTHTMFAGEVVGSRVLKEGDPMTYAYYHKVKNGKASEAAPTYRGNIEKEDKNGGK
ncbi:MAG: flavin reductase family protein [Elusimicrobiota bacterium]|nr:flavin reductase family protein [Elusimicrobiota bacterium]